jgi:hypothetical protein
MNDIEILRLSLQRVAETTADPDILKFIPKSVSTDRGWNGLCATLMGWIEEKRGA